MSKTEGSLEAPERHALAWREEAFFDKAALEEEERRVFDICHTCRRCFNLCDSFPRMFEFIDESPSGELDSVATERFDEVAEACTLCDMCFMTKCPYVPPHEFNIDFPHLMLRHRALMRKDKQKSWRKIWQKSWRQRQLGALLSRTDFNARLVRGLKLSGLVNFLLRQNWVRFLAEKLFTISAKASLPPFAAKPLSKQAQLQNPKTALAELPFPPNPKGAGKGKKVLLYASCQSEHHQPEVGMTALKLLAHLGVEVRFLYDSCCAMPKLEQGDIAAAAKAGEKLSALLAPYLEEGFEIITPTASCALMFKSEYPLLLPDNQAVKNLAAGTKDLTHYLADLMRDEGSGEKLQALPGGLAVHMACHARAQNAGPKAVELLRAIPDTKLTELNRCSGHGGIFGVMVETRPLAEKIGRAPVRQMDKAQPAFIASDCPLAAAHLRGQSKAETPPKALHPVQALALAFGFDEKEVAP